MSTLNATATRAALQAAHLWDGFKLQAAAHHWDNMHMLATVATGQLPRPSVLTELAYLANQG